MTNWTLFLDRDGVINKRLPGDYVKEWSAFEFIDGTLEGLNLLSHLFPRIVVVTNQQGVGKELMTAEAVDAIHQQMQEVVLEAGGRIDAVYFCGDLAEDPENCRKPSPKMALQAQKDFPEIDFGASIMVGDSLSDIEFANRLGMEMVWIAGKEDEAEDIQQRLIDGRIKCGYTFESLLEMATYFVENITSVAP